MDASRIDELEQKFAENPRRFFAPLANEYRKAGNPQRAIEICRAHLGQMPGHMSGQVVYGQALFEVGDFKEARTVFENALAMAANYAQVKLNDRIDAEIESNPTMVDDKAE